MPPLRVWELFHSNRKFCFIIVYYVHCLNFTSSRFLYQNQRRIARLCIDESHTLITESDYRKGFTRVVNAQHYSFPKVFLSGTLPPTLIPDLLKFVELHPDVHIIRMSTSRPELAYHVEYVETEEELEKATLCLAHHLHHSTFDSYSRGIIFAFSRTDAERISVSLGCLCYHAKMNKEDRTQAHNRWRLGKTLSDQWIVATSAFSHGIDQPYITAIIFACRFHNFIKFAQAAARGGRKDSKRCEVVTFFTSQSVSVPKVDRGLAKEFNQWFDSAQCRRIGISTALDGDAYTVTCQTLPNAEFCDYCQNQYGGNVQLPIQESLAYAKTSSSKVLRIDEIPHIGKTNGISSNAKVKQQQEQQRKRSVPEDSTSPSAKRREIDLSALHRVSFSSRKRHYSSQHSSQALSSKHSTQSSHQSTSHRSQSASSLSTTGQKASRPHTGQDPPVILPLSNSNQGPGQPYQTRLLSVS